LEVPVSDKPISATELQDYRLEVEELGFNYNDFEVSFLRHAPDVQANGSYILRESVTITRGGTSRTYLGGHGYAWGADAIADLKAGVFGMP
jgi:hypothetical protein